MAFTGINKSTGFFNTKLYTGTGSSQILTGIGFSPDLIWTGTLNETEIRPMNDSVNGINNYLRSNDVDTLETGGSNITAQSSDGYTVGTGDRFNESSNSFVSWNWKANGQGSANSDGTITTTYTSVDTTAGFSISKWTGTGSAATVGHGLGVAPKMILMKRLNGTNGWVVYNESAGAGKYLRLNTSAAEASDTNIFNNTAPTSTVFSLGTDTDNNGSSDTYVAYSFAEKQGFSKFGSYVGNGSTNGPFIYTAFKPGFVLIKKLTGAAESWFLNDNKRSLSGGFNTNYYYMRPDENSAQGTSSSLSIDLLSNGVKIKNNDTSYNNNNSTYIYMVYAAAPIVGTNNIPANAF